MTDAQCTQGCVKGGAKYVFVSKGMVYQIANQDMAAVMKEAVESVSLTGDVNGDTITVSKVMMAKKK
jgi:butyrate kinase